MENLDLPPRIKISETWPNGCISTFSGRWVNIADPQPETIDIEDIAHSLSRQCRFLGHTNRFYSVAQHSILMMGKVPHGLQGWALMHDATEAYLVDVPRPVKQFLPGYKELELKFRRVIADKFNLPWEEPEGCPIEVKKADNWILEAEWYQLLFLESFKGDLPPQSEIRDRIIEQGIDFRVMDLWYPQVAKRKFLDLARLYL